MFGGHSLLLWQILAERSEREDARRHEQRSRFLRPAANVGADAASF
jgi:hypothetical protein